MSNALEVRGFGMDPVSVMACSWVVAGIPKRGTRGCCLSIVVEGIQVPIGLLVGSLRGLLRTSL